jgi:hypothetical protein
VDNYFVTNTATLSSSGRSSYALSAGPTSNNARRTASATRADDFASRTGCSYMPSLPIKVRSVVASFGAAAETLDSRGVDVIRKEVDLGGMARAGRCRPPVRCLRTLEPDAMKRLDTGRDGPVKKCAKNRGAAPDCWIDCGLCPTGFARSSVQRPSHSTGMPRGSKASLRRRTAA